MSDFDDRKKGMEDQYFRDEERSLKLKSRRDRLLASWIAGLIGRDDLAVYAEEIVDARFRGGGDAGVISKALADLHGAGHNISEQDLATKMQELTIQAAQDL